MKSAELPADSPLPAAAGRRPGPGGRGGAISRRLLDFAELSKIRIAGLSTLSAATGYGVFLRAADPGIITCCLGVLLLAMGACALNEFQDRDLDRLMARTRRRPIPGGAIRPGTALAAAMLLIAGGLVVLGRLHGPAASLLGSIAVGWYNGVYTYLKRVWAFAVVPGALIGALPPVIGWAAAGGDPLDPRVAGLAFFFFIWQVPHFWLLLFEHGSDYEEAGLPSLTRLFSRRQLASLTFIWILATLASSLLLSLYGLVDSPWTSLGLAACGVWLAWRATGLVHGHFREKSLSPAFRSINLYALLVMALLFADALI